MLSSHLSKFIFLALAVTVLFASCSEDEPLILPALPDQEPDPVEVVFNGQLDLSDPYNYATQPLPAYITRDNTGDNLITDAGATLGRVLFYDKALSTIGTVACASCHQQELAFGDVAIASTGVAGTTSRHSMRLVNARFGREARFFWNERAATLEDQTVQPIRDHIEMGFSDRTGGPSFDDLLDRLNGLDYYAPLFTGAFGSAEATEERISEALAQFIRSIQSFDSKYDAGRVQVNNEGEPFPNFTEEENRGRDLFGNRPQFNNDNVRIGGGLGCGPCHESPEFAIDPRSGNNGITASIGGAMPEFGVTRSPTLRNLFRPDGGENGPYMHNGSLRTIDDVLDHYNAISAINPQLDGRLMPGNTPLRLNITQEERSAVIAFLKTLAGTAVYSDERWSNPFVE